MTIALTKTQRMPRNASKIKILIVLAKAGSNALVPEQIADNSGVAVGYCFQKLSAMFRVKTGCKDNSGKTMHQLVLRSPVEKDGHYVVGYRLSKYGYDRLEWFRVHRPQLYQNALIELDKIAHPEKYLSVEEQDRILREAAKEEKCQKNM